MKRILIFITLFIFFIVFFLFIKFDNTKENKIVNSEEFVINKVIYYSSANANSKKTNYQNPEWNLDVYQYTDIALYINRINSISDKNFISKIVVNNLKTNFEKDAFYYLEPNNFANWKINDFNLLKNNFLEYTVLNSSNIDNEQKYNIPLFFQDCSNPLTFRIVNYLSNNYKIVDNVLKYNGSLINILGYNVKDIEKVLTFNLEIYTKDGNKREKEIKLDIKFEDNEKSIINGEFQIEKNENIKF